jgi:tetratricopeptide (TPR) repeat protein
MWASALTLGDIKLELGQYAEAAEHYQSGYQASLTQGQLTGHTPSATRNEYAAVEKLGDVEFQIGRLDSSLTHYERARSERLRLMTDYPSTEFTRDYGVSLISLGKALSAKGQIRSAIARYEECVALRRAAVRDGTGSDSKWRDLFNALIDLGDALEAAGLVARSEASYLSAASAMEHLSPDFLCTVRGLRDQLLCRTKLGDSRFAAGDRDGGRCEYFDALRIADQLTAMPVVVRGALRDKMTIENRLARVDLDERQFASADARLETSNRLCMYIADQSGNSIGALRDVAVQHGLLGYSDFLQRDLYGALTHHSAAVTTIDQVELLWGRSKATVEQRAGARMKIGDVYAALNQFDQAIEHYLASRELFVASASDFGLSPRSAIGQSTCSAILAQIFCVVDNAQQGRIELAEASRVADIVDKTFDETIEVRALRRLMSSSQKSCE